MPDFYGEKPPGSVCHDVRLHKSIVDTSKAAAIDKETMAEDDKVLAVKNRDGSNTAYIFSEPIYYEDADGQIRTKDISIQKVKDKTLSELGYDFENGQNDIRIHFSKDPAVGTKVSSDSWAYSLSPAGKQVSRNLAESLGDKVRLSNMGERFDAFQYKNLYGSGSALNFYPELNGLKDEIILSTVPSSPVFEFTLTTTGATADLNKDGTISIIDKKTKEAVQAMNAPFAYDSEYLGDDPADTKHYSPATFTLSSPEKKDGAYTYTLRVVLNEEWLSAKSTKYPITIDPSSSTITNYFDTAVYSSKASNNYGTSTTACFGRSSTYGYGRVLVFFVLPSTITSGCTINSAYYWFRETTGRTTNTYLTPYMVGSTWNETTATWNNKPSYYDFSAQPTKCINGASTDSSSSPHWYKFDIQTAVNAWAQGWGQNLGLCFVSNEETNGAYNWRAFATRDYTTSSYRPYAVVNYSDDTTPPTATGISGNATYWTNQNVTLSIDGAADSGSGLATEPYSFSTDPNVKYWQASNTKTFTENATVYIHLRDAEGNIAYLGTQVINCIDKVKPSSPTVTGVPTTWTNQPYTLHAHSTDDASGMWAYSFSTIEFPGEWTFGEDKELTGNATYYVYAIDNAGNVSPPTPVTVDKYDATAPVISDVAVAESTQSNKVRYTVTATDATSGIAAYSFDGGTSWQQSNSADVDVDLALSEVQVKDNAGNIGTYSASAQVPVFYMDGQLVGLVDPVDSGATLQYKLGATGEWNDYENPFSIPAFETTTVYARLGENGIVVHKDIASVTQYYGSYTESATDATLTYRNVEFDLLRSYDSANHNWFFSVESTVVQENAFVYKVTLPDATEFAFIREASDRYVNELNGYTLIINRDNDGNISGYQVAIDDTSYVYSPNGRLLRLTNKYGDQITLAWTARSGSNTGTLSDYSAVDIYDAASTARHYLLAINSIGKITSVTDPVNNTITYSYDSNGNLTGVVDQAGVTTGEYRYTETASGSGVYRLTKSSDKTIQYNAAGRVAKELWDSGFYTNYAYDDTINTILTESADDTSTSTTYNDAFLVASESDEEGDATSYTYNNQFQLLTETIAGTITSYVYNAIGNLLQIITGSENPLVYLYNASNQVVKETSDDATVYYVYNALGDTEIVATLKEDYTGIAPEEYDATLSCFDTVTYTYDNGMVTRTVDSKSGITTDYVYDQYGNVARTSVATVAVDEEGHQTSTLTVTDKTYDLFGRVVSSTTSTSANDTESSSAVYDAAGRTLKNDVRGDVTRTLYDSLGRVVQEIGPEDYDSTKDGLPNANTYNDSSAGTTYVYGADNTLTSETNRIGKTTNYYYNSDGCKAREHFDIYDFYYRNHGEPTEVRINGAEKVTYDYNASTHLLQSVSYANGDTIGYAYDTNKNVVSETRNNEATPYVTYSYDSENELTQIINYDTGRKTVYGSNGSVTVYKLSDNSVIQSYTESNNEEQITDPADLVTTVNESYFGTNYSSTVSNGGTSFAGGSSATSNYSFTLNNDDNIATEAVNYNGTNAFTTSYSYDANDNITSKAITLADNTSLDIVNTYDSKNRVTGTGLGSVQQTYSYDQYEQLTGTVDTANGFTESYTYDSRGNILTKTKVYDDENTPAETTTFTYGNSAWPDELTSVNGTSLTYDANGNVLTYGNMEFEWTNGRVLSQITVNPEDPNDTADIYSYTYDESGIRTSKTVNGTTTYFTTRDGVILSQTDGTNTLYFQYDNRDVPVGFQLNGTQYFYLTNQMGDVIGITDSAGSLIATYTYGAWGEVLAITPATSGSSAQLAIANANPLRYRGYYWDAETGYYYLQSRYYSSLLARFMIADNLHFVLDTKEDRCGENLYLYVSNCPIDMVDKTGCKSKKIKIEQKESLLVLYVRKHIKQEKDSGVYVIFNKSAAACSAFLAVQIKSKVSAIKSSFGKTEKGLIIKGYYEMKMKGRGAVTTISTKIGENTVYAKYTKGIVAEGLVGYVSTTSRVNSYSKLNYIIYYGIKINNLTKSAAKVAVVGLCAAIGSVASAAMGSIGVAVVDAATQYAVRIASIVAPAMAVAAENMMVRPA